MMGTKFYTLFRDGKYREIVTPDGLKSGPAIIAKPLSTKSMNEVLGLKEQGYSDRQIYDLRHQKKAEPGKKAKTFQVEVDNLSTTQLRKVVESVLSVQAPSIELMEPSELVDLVRAIIKATGTELATDTSA